MISRKEKPYISIRTWSISASLMTGFFVFIISAFSFIYNDIVSFEKNWREQISIKANLLSSYLVASLAFDDATDAQKVLSTLANDKDLAAAFVLDVNSKIFAHVGLNLDLQRILLEFKEKESKGKNFFDEGKLLYFSTPIKQKSSHLGQLILVHKPNWLDQQYQSYFFIVGISTALSITLTLLLSSLFHKPLSGPIKKLVEWTQLISQNKDYSVRIRPQIEKVRIKEYILLVDSFDEMLRQIQDRDLAISKANEDLEVKVLEKTQELVKAQEELIQNGKMAALGEMASGIAHEVNNPLTVIIGVSGSLLRKVKAGSVENTVVLTELEKIQKMGDRISKIIKGLKTFSRDGRNDQFEKSSIKHIVEESLELCNTRLKNHGIELRNKIEKDIVVDCRASQIEQVIINLVNNAHDAIQDRDEKWIEMDARDVDGKLILTVTDSGPGIPQAMREKIMQPFFTTKEVGKGTGLGLSISSGIIKSHLGKLEIDTNCPNTRFVLTIPLVHNRQLT